MKQKAAYFSALAYLTVASTAFTASTAKTIYRDAPLPHEGTSWSCEVEGKAVEASSKPTDGSKDYSASKQYIKEIDRTRIEYPNKPSK